MRRTARCLVPLLALALPAVALEVVVVGVAGVDVRVVNRAVGPVVVVVGGDGTCSKVAQQILNARSQCAVALIPCGTGNDIAKTLGVYGAKPAEVLSLVARGKTARIDVGRADGHYVWHVDPSSRPVALMAGRTEAWTLSCGTESRQVSSEPVPRR